MPRLALLLLLLGSCPAITQSNVKKSCVEPQITADSTFQPGQVWSYKTRTGEEGSTVTILRVENAPKLGTIVHIRIDGVHFSNCTGRPAPRVVEHAPFTKGALEGSLVQKVRSVATLPDYSAGYDNWLRHCGGVYTISVAQMIALDDAQFGASLGCNSNSN